MFMTIHNWMTRIQVSVRGNLRKPFGDLIQMRSKPISPTF